MTWISRLIKKKTVMEFLDYFKCRIFKFSKKVESNAVSFKLFSLLKQRKKTKNE